MLDFLGIGAQKAGTSWIFANLKQHPDIRFPYDKEIHFWNNPNRDITWYVNLFSASTKQKQGEITPAYGMLPIEVIKEIYELNPKLRIFYSMRDPRERAWSSAMMALRRAEMSLDEASDQWFIDHFTSKGSLGRGDYLRCLSNWYRVFRKEQILVLDYHRIPDDPLSQLIQICHHIGIDPSYFTKHPEHVVTERINEGPGKDIRPSLVPFLNQLYKHKMEAFHTLYPYLFEKQQETPSYIIYFSPSEEERNLFHAWLETHPCISIIAKPAQHAEDIKLMQLYPVSPITRAVVIDGSNLSFGDPLLQAISHDNRFTFIGLGDTPDPLISTVIEHHDLRNITEKTHRYLCSLFRITYYPVDHDLSFSKVKELI